MNDEEAWNYFMQFAVNNPSNNAGKALIALAIKSHHPSEDVNNLLSILTGGIVAWSEGKEYVSEFDEILKGLSVK